MTEPIEIPNAVETKAMPVQARIADSLLEGMRQELSDDDSWVALGKLLGVSANRFSQWRAGRNITLGRLDQLIADWNALKIRPVRLVLLGGECRVEWGPKGE